MTITLSTGKEVDVLTPASLLDLTPAEYEELLKICKERSKERAA